MNTIKRINLLLLMVFIITTNLYGGNYKVDQSIITPDIKSKLESKLLEAQLGTEYYVIVPPNDLTVGNYMCEMYIGSREPCKFYIEQPSGRGLMTTGSILKPYSIVKYALTRELRIRGKFERLED